MNGRRGLFAPRPNLRRRADLKNIWARNFPLFHLECYLVRELMKSDPSNLRGQLWEQQQHQETRLNGSEQHFHQQACLWWTREWQWLQRLEYQQNVQTANQLRALDQKIEIYMQLEKVTGNKWTKVLQQQPMIQCPTSLKLSGSQPRKKKTCYHRTLSDTVQSVDPFKSWASWRLTQQMEWPVQEQKHRIPSQRGSYRT